MNGRYLLTIIHSSLRKYKIGKENRIHWKGRSYCSAATLDGYSKFYWLIHGKPIVRYLDKYVRDGKYPALERFGSLLRLLPAWSGELEWAAENRFIWEMSDRPEALNVPILFCEDDCDLSCIVILARIRKTEDFIFWSENVNWMFAAGQINDSFQDIPQAVRTGYSIWFCIKYCFIVS